MEIEITSKSNINFTEEEKDRLMQFVSLLIDIDQKEKRKDKENGGHN